MSPPDSSIAASQVVTCRLGDMFLGIDASGVREIRRNLTIAPVPRAPEYVQGIANLRGSIITVIDLATLLGIRRDRLLDDCTIVVSEGGESIALVVDSIGDVVDVIPDAIAPLPGHFAQSSRRFIDGVYEMEPDIIVLVNVGVLLAAGPGAISGELAQVEICPGARRGEESSVA